MKPSYVHLTPLRHWRRSISMFMCFLMLMLSTGCTNYYKVKVSEEDDEKRQAFTRVLNERNYFILTSGDQRMMAQKIEARDNAFSMNLTPVPPWIDTLHTTYIDEKKKRYNPKSGKEILHEVRIEVAGIALQEGPVEIPFSAVTKVEVYDHDTGRAILSVLGVTIGLFVLVTIIIALTKSSCPFIYSYDGNKYTLEGEAFGGAIFSPIERDDYVPLKSIRPVDGKYMVNVRNELKERQFINSTSLIVVDHARGDQVVTDRLGHIHTISDPRGPMEAWSGNGSDLQERLFQRDNLLYQFDDPANGQDADEMKLRFRRPVNAKNAKLVLNVKGSLWLDFLYGEFIKKFGSYYNTWAEDQKDRSTTELNEWFFDQYLPLNVFVKNDGEWEYVDYVSLIGPLADERDVVIPLQDYISADAEQVEVKIQTGFMFWDIDYAAMDFTPNSQVQIREVFPEIALDQDGNDKTSALHATDQQYVEQLQIGDELTLEFPSSTTEMERSVYLKIRGYYEHVREFEGSPDWFELLSFKTDGRFTSFSRERYEEISAPLNEMISSPKIYADAD